MYNEVSIFEDLNTLLVFLLTEYRSIVPALVHFTEAIKGAEFHSWRCWVQREQNTRPSH